MGRLLALFAGVVDVDELWGWAPALGEFREAVAVRVAAVAWHDSEPGRLAWLTCSRTPGEPGTFGTLDVTDDASIPVLIRSVERVCDENSRVELEAWGDWGFAAARWGEEGPEFVLLDVDGTEVASIGDDSGDTAFFAGSGGTILTEDLPGPGAPSFLLPVDSQRRDPVPGLADDEWVDGALWSPDGSLLALILLRSITDVPVIRIVEVATGAGAIPQRCRRPSTNSPCRRGRA